MCILVWAKGVHYFFPPLFLLADASFVARIRPPARLFAAEGLLFGVGPGFVLRFIASVIASAVTKRSRPCFSDSISPRATICRTRAGVTPRRSAASFVVNLSLLMRAF